MTDANASTPSFDRFAERLHGRHGTHSRSATPRTGAAPASWPADVTDAGFALTEVIVATAIFGIVAAAAVLGITAGINTASVTQQRVATANVAQQALQQAVTAPQASLTASPTATSTATVGTSQYKVTRSISFSPAGATACPTAATSTPYAMVVHVVAVPVTGSSRSVAMDTVIAC